MAIKTSEQNEDAVRRFSPREISFPPEPKATARSISQGEQLNEQGRHPATVVNTRRGRRSRTGARAVALVRDARTVRQAFVASLVFGPPKAFES